MVNDDMSRDALIQMFFQDESFEVTWMELKQEYETLGFRDPLTDEEMIREFKDIKQNLRKYKFSHQEQILKHDTIEEMANEVERLIGIAAEYSDSRKGIVYNFMRDHWLFNLYNTLIEILRINNVGEEDEDE